jgi:hypothetical protein
MAKLTKQARNDRRREISAEIDKYRLPDEVYAKTIRQIRRYEELKFEYDSIPDITRNMGEFTTERNYYSDPTADKAIKRGKIKTVLDAVDNSLLELPEGLREHVFAKARCPRMSWSRELPKWEWRKWQGKFVYGVAQRLGYLAESEGE